MKRYDQATSTPGAVVSYRRIPTRAPTIQADVLVPALTGLFVGLFGGLFMALMFTLIFGDYFWMSFGIFATTFVLGGFAARVWLNQGDISATEEIERMPGEPDVPRLEMPALPVLLNPYVGKDRADKEQRADEHVARDEFIRGCQYDTSARRWKDEPNAVKWRESLIASGWASWRKENEPRAGWKLNADSERIIEALKGE